MPPSTLTVAVPSPQPQGDYWVLATPLPPLKIQGKGDPIEYELTWPEKM